MYPIFYLLKGDYTPQLGQVLLRRGEGRSQEKRWGFPKVGATLVGLYWRYIGIENGNYRDYKDMGVFQN